MFHRKNYFFRGLTLTVAVVALPLAGLLAYALHTTRSNGIKASHSSLVERATNAANLADGALDHVKQVLDFLASRPELRSLSKEACNTFVKGFPVRSSIMTEVGIIRLDGRAVCIASDPHTPAMNFKERPWFKEALVSEDLHISKPYRDMFTGRWSVLMSRMLRSDEGERIAFLGVAIDVETMADRFLPLSALPEGSNFGFVMADGTIMTISGGRAQWLAQPLPEVIRSKIADAVQAPVESQGLDGSSQLFVAAPMRLFKMHATVSVPQHEVVAASETSARQSAAVAFVVIISALMLSWYLAHRLSLPISSLTRTAREVGAGNPHAVANESLPGEFKLLAQEFNKALSAVRQSEEVLRAKATAEAASKAKSDFLANMSHEIRTPINAIMGMTDLALRQKITPKARDYITKVQQSSRSLLGIINDILDFSKIEARKLEIVIAEFSIQELLDRVTDAVGLQANRRGLELLFDIEPNVPKTVQGDSLRLEQVLVNLFSNAIKFSRENQVILLTLSRYSNECLRFSVRDAGPGLTDGQIAQIFESFTQLESPNARKHSGTGLGLTICRQLVELMGGAIDVVSEPGVGSEFYFTVPLVFCEENLDEKRLMDARILLIEDAPEARRIIGDILIRAGAKVDMAATADAAWQILALGEVYDAVLVDSTLPDCDTITLVKELHATKCADKRFLILSSYGGEKYTLLEEEAGFINYLEKPITHSLLVRALSELMAGSSGLNESFENSPDNSPTALRGGRVLLVEDTEFNQILTNDLLVDFAGMDVTIASDGDEALLLLAQGGQFDLILMDIQMPKMNGYEVTQKIRALPHMKNVPVIAMTAYAMAIDRQRSLDAGMNDYITKPFRPSELFATLGRWLGKVKNPDLSATLELNTRDDQAVTEILDRKPAVDMAEGLRRCLGIDALYDRMILRFLESHEQDEAIIQKSLAEDDINVILAIAHNTTSSAGTIGARTLCELAREIQDISIVSPEISEIRPAVHAFVAEHRRVVAELRNISVNRQNF